MSNTGHLPELESLRSQVADLARELTERDQSMRAQSRHLEQTMQDLREQSDLLRAIVEGTAPGTGEEFFRSLVKHLAKAIKVRYAFVGKWRQETPATVRVLAMWPGSAIADPFEYNLRNTPSDNVVGRRVCLYESGVQRRFPEDHLLAQLDVESYCGMPLFDRSGKPLGLLVVMHDRPMTQAPVVKDLVQIFATRAAAELQRQQDDAACREIERRSRFTQFAVGHAQDGILWADDSNRLIYANGAACQSLGYSNEELLTLSISDIAPYHDPSRFAQRPDGLKKSPAATYESVHRRKDGTEFPVEVSVNYLEHEGNGYTCGVIRNITERKRIEQERLQALSDLQNIMETVPDVMFTLDIQGNLVKWNRRIGEVTGYSPEELLNKPALAFVPTEERDRTAAAIQRAFTEGYAELEGHMLTKGYRTIPYHWTGAALKNPQGKIIGITGIGRDVSDKKRAEEELQRQQRHLVEAQALAHLGSWEWVLDSGDVHWSDEQYRIFGHEPGSISVTHETLLAALLPDDHDRVLAAINDALAGKTPYAIECRIVRPNGDVRVINCLGEVHRDAAGHPLRLDGTVLDVTERTVIEEALRAGEERWQLAVRGSHDGIWDWNIRTGEVFFSAQWKAMRGYAESEPADSISEWQSRIHPDDLDRVLQRIDQYLAKQRPEYCEDYRVERKDGTYMWVLDRGVALWADDGTPLRMTGSESDITERKRAEESLVRGRDLMKSFVEHTPVAVAMLDRSLRYVAVSRRWLDDYRLGHQPLIGRHHYDVFPEIKDMKKWQEIHQRCLSGEVERREEDRFIRADGSEDWLRWEIRPWHDITGEIGGIIMFMEVITERKQAETALRVSEERYARATAVGKVGVWELDVAAGTYYGDVNLKALFGYGGDELSADPFVWLTLVHPDDQSIALDHWQRIVTGETDSYHYELRMLKKDGTVIWTDVRGHAVRSHEGQLTHLFGATVDITDRKKAQEALAKSERQLRTVLDALPVGVWFTDQAGRSLLANPTATQIWSNVKRVGLQNPDNPIGWWESVEPANEPHRWALSRTLATGEPSLNETIDLDCLDGTRKSIRNTTVPVKDENGIVLGAIVLNEDITSLRHAEEALKLTQFSVDQAVEGFFWISPDARILNVNQAACRLLEYTRDELMAMTLHDINPNFPPEVWPAHWEELKQTGSMTVESKHWSKTGRVLDTEVTVNYLRYEGKEYNCAIMRDIGERRRADAALRLSEERYRSLYDDTPIMYFTLATDGTVYSVNRFGAEQLGYRVEELVGNSVLGLFHEDDQEVVAARLSECLATPETTRHWELRKVRKDGSIIWTGETARVGQSSTGETIVLVTGENITERKRTEATLRRSEERFRTIFTQAPIGMALVDSLTGKLHEVNSKLAQIAGRTTEELRGLDWMSITHPDDVQTDLDNTARLIAGEIAGFQMEKRYIRPDGAVAWINLAVAPIQVEEHAGPRHLAMSEDITERKEAEASLRQSEERYRSLVDNAPIGIFVNEEGRFAYVNREMQKILNATSAEQLIGTTVLDRIAPEFHQVVKDRIHELLEKNQPVPSLDERYVRLDGSLVDVAVTAIPTSFDGTPVMQVLVLDITERKQTEEALRHREQDLLAALEERERISEDLHDGILQSLYAIGLGLEACKPLIAQPPRKKATANLMPVFNHAIGQLNHVMAEVRNFIAGLESQVLQGGDFATALRTMVETMSASNATACRVTIEDAAARHISTEQALHLINVTREALSNSLRHSHAKRTTVSLKQLVHSVRLSVTDNGVGFTPATAHGIGHGLPNMAARAQKIGGRLGVRSKPGQGTKILLDLPKETMYAHN